MSDLTLDGLASGMPTQDIINQLMAVESRPLVHMQEEQDELRTEKNAWRDIRTRLNSLGDALTDLELSSTFDSNTTTSSDEDVVTATASTSATEGNYEIEISQLAQTHRVASAKQVDSTSDLDLDNNTGGTFGITIGKGTSNEASFNVTVSGDDSLNDIMDKINTATNNDDGSGNQLVNASVVDNTLVIESAETGNNNALSFTDSADDGGVTGGVLQELGIIDGTGTIQNELQASQDSKFSVNGISVTRSSNIGIDDVINGVTLNLQTNAEVDPVNSITDKATITVSRDTEKTVEAVQAFVDQYNSSMGFIDEKSDYSSDTEKAAVLQGDSTLSRLQLKLRQYVTERVADSSINNYNQLASVGIEIDKDGVMSFDSSKLEDALKDDPEAVKKMFNADSSDGDSYDGVAVKLDSYIDVLASTTGTIPDTIDSYERRINSLDDSMSDFKDRLEMRRQSLLEQFTAMEKAMSKMNNQSNWMMSQLNSMGGSSLLSSMM